ncbi:hypothetical protein CFK37_17955 [Virgibacillus phasianinus]|uniref:Uncharacterized protein n=1 Tax=Virgibacillus phasianinus TaxID=2017483 RepID=A0A220U791_9BACI|nr:hypothetical protein [Virgibacillus phasianinus]ASK63905.1 hypothetical protein CFK37_17955 [Virgibacillus phasianinus]
MEKTIHDFIILPLALKVFRRDYQAFKVSKVGNVYLDKLDTVIDQLQKDINLVKHQLITVHHIDVKYYGKENGVIKYMCKKNNEPGIVEFTPMELKELTGKVMRVYLYGDKSVEFEHKERAWE